VPNCPYCGAAVEQQPGEVVLTCPYCGTAFAVGGGEVGRHLMGRVNFTIQQVLEAFKSWALRMPETPNDFLGAAHLRDYQLVFYPFWIYEVVGRVRAGGGVMEEAVEVSLPAHRSMTGTPLENLLMSPVGKVYYSHRHVVETGGRLLNPDVGPEEADRLALSLGRKAVMDSLRRRLGSRPRVESLDLRIASRALVHAPVYVCTYSYRDRSYRFMADASDSSVLYAEVPIELRFRAVTLAAGSLSLLAALATLAAVDRAPAFSLVSATGFLIVGLIAVYKGLRLRVTVRRYPAGW